MIKKLFLSLFFLFALATSCFGAEIMIRITNNWMRDADQTGWVQEKIDKANRQYEVGDVESVHEDGTYPVNTVIGTSSVLVKIPGLSVELAEKLLLPAYKDGETIPLLSSVMTKRRRFKFDLNLLPLKNKDELNTKKITTINLLKSNEYIIDKATTTYLKTWEIKEY